MRRTAYILSAWTLLLAACGPAASPPPAAPAATTAPAPAAAQPTTAAAAAPAAAKPTTAAAAPAAPAPTAAPAAAAAPAAGARGAGGMLKILYWQAPTILNEHLSQGTKDQDASRLVLEPLASLGPDGKPIPNLAAEIPTLDNGGIAKDQKSITWKLKPGVKWSDGTPFTADDVVFTWQYIADPEDRRQRHTGRRRRGQCRSQGPDDGRGVLQGPQSVPLSDLHVDDWASSFRRSSSRTSWVTKPRMRRATWRRSAPVRTRWSTSNRATS